MKKKIKNALLALNYGVAVAICLTMVITPTFSFGEKAIYGFSAIFLGMGIQRLLKKISD